NIREIYDEMSLQIDKKRMILDAPMKEYTSFRAGGNAALLIQPGNAEELAFALKTFTARDTEHMVIGNGSNLLVRDSGYRGVILRMGEPFQHIATDGGRLEAGAGALLSTAAREALGASLTGLEFAAGIPGTVGGAVFMNAGAYDGEISQVLESAELLSKDGARTFTLSKGELELSYRHSLLQQTGDVLLKAVFRLEKGEREKINDKMKELAAKRTEKQPLNYPSAGSFFKRPPGHFAGKLIQDSGLRGLTVGGAQVSALHAGFIINTGGATATDIVDLMEIVRSTVFEKFGILLEPEVRIIGEEL
ncbi:MAG TPA: UDP-N-acetylmuramate dehydrogenase, partial [Anaerovoracaceae bacterium]|nr:UDP-N-acetylmuramate dehydrogenase [Anaerovoracaceae bacterium]